MVMSLYGYQCSKSGILNTKSKIPSWTSIWIWTDYDKEDHDKLKDARAKRIFISTIALTTTSTTTLTVCVTQTVWVLLLILQLVLHENSLSDWVLLFIKFDNQPGFVPESFFNDGRNGISFEN